MQKTVFARISDTDFTKLTSIANDLDRPLSWLIRRALIDQGYLEVGK